MAPAIPFIMLAVSAAGAVGQAASAKQAGEVASQNAEREGVIADHNARLVVQQTDRREEMVRRQTRQRLGQMRAAGAQAGVGLGGSTADIYRQASGDAEMDALNTRYGGMLESVDYINKAAGSRYNAKTAKMQGKAEASGHYMRAGASLLAGPNGNMWARAG